MKDSKGGVARKSYKNNTICAKSEFLLTKNIDVSEQQPKKNINNNNNRKQAIKERTKMSAKEQVPVLWSKAPHNSDYWAYNCTIVFPVLTFSPNFVVKLQAKMYHSNNIRFKNKSHFCETQMLAELSEKTGRIILLIQ